MFSSVLQVFWSYFTEYQHWFLWQGHCYGTPTLKTTTALCCQLLAQYNILLIISCNTIWTGIFLCKFMQNFYAILQPLIKYQLDWITISSDHFFFTSFSSFTLSWCVFPERLKVSISPGSISHPDWECSCTNLSFVIAEVFCFFFHFFHSCFSTPLKGNLMHPILYFEELVQKLFLPGTTGRGWKVGRCLESRKYNPELRGVRLEIVTLMGNTGRCCSCTLRWTCMSTEQEVTEVLDKKRTANRCGI